jgi:DNA repair protein RecO (recombination protein O)
MVEAHDQGLIYRYADYSESSLIVSWLTRGHGLVRTLAKGASRPRQKFHGRLDAFHRAQIVFLPSRRSHLHTLVDLETLDANRWIRADYLHFLMASHAFEVVTLLAEEDTPIPEIYDWMEAFLSRLAGVGTAEEARLLLEAYESGLFERCGVHQAAAGLVGLRRKHFHRAPKVLPLLKRELARRGRGTGSGGA